MAEKKTRRERLSARDHKRSHVTANAMLLLLTELVMMYPGDVDLTMAVRGLDSFRGRVLDLRDQAALEELKPAPAPPLLEG